ncbi:hypothetical protein VP1G_06882 [Cytospora mali]|uniref:Heterokaryon incompatibility domain-containing protein n=1 Tax=Cytospora mali TaxID=578113 RepID=A0A194V6V6_CYTMA|nr:hypothetical protein VP1G_06882 [Valsa mali var. pyri (nom. inval.)]
MSCIEASCPYRGLVAEYDRMALGLAAEVYTGQQGHEATWPRALKNWAVVREELEKEGSVFVTRISPFQRHLAMLLREWWYSRIEANNDTMTMLKNFMENNIDQPIPLSIQTTMTTYAIKLCNLFVSEFVDLQGVTFRRRVTQDEAGWIGACRRAATLTASHMKRELDRQENGATITIQTHLPNRPSSVRLQNAVLEPCPWLPDHAKHSLPYFLWDIEGKRTLRFHEQEQRPDYAIVSHTWGRWRVDGDGVRIEGVPWLVPCNTRFDVERLPDELLNNIAVFGGLKHIWFDLLCIPQDRSELAQVEISRQAAIFGNAKLAICWMSSIGHLEGLRWAITWLAVTYAHLESGGTSDERMDSVMNVVDHITRSFPGLGVPESLPMEVRFKGLVPGPASVDKAWFSSLWTLQEAVLRPDMVMCDRQWRVMRLVDQHCEPIPVDYMMALVKWYSLKLKEDAAQENRLSRNAPMDPLPVVELASLLNMSGLAGLMLAPTALAVLAAADRRQCSGQRAEAIMSVVGASLWYRQESECENQKIVLGRYPVQFLRETREREGASFFASQYGNYCCFWDVFMLDSHEDHVCFPRWPFKCQDCQQALHPVFGELPTRIAGTMLPFDPLRYNSKINYLVPRGIGHSTVDTWRIADDGRVIMPQVAVIASTNPAFNPASSARRPITARWYVWGPEFLEVSVASAPSGNMCGTRNTNLEQYLSQALSTEPARETHVVLILAGQTVVQGVILVQLNPSEKPVRTFAKVGDAKLESGNFGITMNPGNAVDWEIL